MGVLMRSRAFLGYVLVLGLASGAMFTYISGSSFVFENLHGVSSGTYSLIFASIAVGMLIAGAVFARAAGRLGMGKLLGIGVGIALLGAVVQIVLVAAVGETLVGTWVSLFVTLHGIGLIFPATMSIGQSIGRAAPGAASALLGGFQFAFGAVASPLVGLFGEDSSVPMALIMLIAVLLAGASMVLLARPWKTAASADAS
jgi:DHA1 family bicyclomycin/chloramphenicol resistance-like MFS transporter